MVVVLFFLFKKKKKAHLRINNGSPSQDHDIYIKSVYNGNTHTIRHFLHFNCKQLRSNSNANYESNADSERMCTFSKAVSVCVCVWGRKRKVFLIVIQVRGSGSSITHDQARVVFGELLAGYLSWLGIPLLGLGLCVEMIRSWRWGVVVVCWGGDVRTGD